MGQFGSTRVLLETYQVYYKKRLINFDISMKLKNPLKTITSYSFNLIANGIVKRPPAHLSNNPYLKFHHNIE